MDKIIVHSTANIKTKKMVYKGFNESTNKWIFKVKYKGYCTQNVADFMAIVHALHYCKINNIDLPIDRKSTRLNSSHSRASRMPSSA